ncbi:PREDICTED: vesicular integral-membrane protein VIP36 [Chaetura pelagica]|uniref:vesicular integral-membrane protein VIP36 n=1 Tax=Chaetura pelagica TaxID=8897 RepID=UPI0005236D38|nr:PREDICTED: vesicular integral-membrane protein VIP36 [Chaetura pelagica]
MGSSYPRSSCSLRAVDGKHMSCCVKGLHTSSMRTPSELVHPHCWHTLPRLLPGCARCWEPWQPAQALVQHPSLAGGAATCAQDLARAHGREDPAGQARKEGVPCLVAASAAAALQMPPGGAAPGSGVWNGPEPCFLKDWELHVHFRIHGAGKKNLHGDGLALWYTQERLVPGPVFGSKDNFHGLAIFLDTYPNDEATERVFPYISAMVNNGSLTYEHSKDGRWTELAGCTADLRNQNHDTFLAIRYSRGRLTVMTDVEDKNEWKNCIDIAGVQLPTGYFFGASAGTGDLSDNHDIISMKLFQLMVEHPLEDETVDWTKIEPSVSLLKSPKDNVDDPTGNFRSGPLTGWKVFLLLLCALLGIIVCAVVGAVVFQKRQERNKRFY